MKILKESLYAVGAAVLTACSFFLLFASMSFFDIDERFFCAIDWFEKALWRIFAVLALVWAIYFIGFRKPRFRFVIIRMLFVWFVYVLTYMIGFACWNLERDLEYYSLLDRLADSPGSLLLYIYVILSLILFHYFLRFARRYRLRRRLIIYVIGCLMICGFFWGTRYAMIYCYGAKHYEHHSIADDNSMGERLQKQMSLITSCITNSAYPDADEFDSRMTKEGLFDPNYYFTVFTNLSLETGYPFQPA